MKTLLVYYSYTGNTKIIANIIKERLNCDILELKPKVPFLIEDYDKVIIGTSVWWYTITPVIREFLKKYDLSSKEVYAFATNAGWLGRTFKEIESYCNVESELNIQFTEDWKEHKYLNSENEINEWINSIKEN